MSGNRQVEIHYINTGFPYSATESFMDFFEGLLYTPPHFDHSAGPSQDQECSYWSTRASPYKYGVPGSGGTSIYGLTHVSDVNGHVSTVDRGGTGWESPSFINNEGLSPSVHGSASSDANFPVDPEECGRNHHSASGSQGLQVFWQDYIDPDNMTYEEMLDLGEAVGTQNRGLSQYLISKLPITKYKCCFFSRKKKRCERCVICQMDFKRRDRQMTLPCKHIYHVGCIIRWLGINKACPICYIEVFGEDSKH